MKATKKREKKMMNIHISRMRLVSHNFSHMIITNPKKVVQVLEEEMMKLIKMRF